MDKQKVNRISSEIRRKRFKGYKQETRRIDTARGGAMGFIQSSNSVHLQTCSEVAEVKIFNEQSHFFFGQSPQQLVLFAAK